MRSKGLKCILLEGLGLYGITLFFSTVLAQCPATIPNIQEYGTGSYSVKKVGSGCLPHTVSFGNSMVGVTNVKTVFDYKGGPLSPEILTTDTLFTYTRPGVYTIVQVSEKDGRKLIACPKVYVTDTLPPKVSLVACGGTSAKVVFNQNQDVEYDTYWISWGDGNIQEVAPQKKSVSHTYGVSESQNIEVWGITKPGFCRSQQAMLRFVPTLDTSRPTIEELREMDDLSGCLKTTNPLKVEIMLQKKSDAGPWENTGRTFRTDNETIKVSIDTTSTLCYRLQAMDSCLVENYKSEMLCTATFTLNPLDQASELNWRTSDQDLTTSIFIQKDQKDWKEIPREGLKGSIQDNDLTCGQEHCYQLIIKNPSYTFVSRSLCRPTPPVYCGVYSMLHIPDAFSPNGDGINDNFEIKGDIGTSFEFSVFNSWGSLIFHTNDLHTSWNGTSEGNPLPQGHYPYKLSMIDPATGKQHIQRGSIMIIR